MCSRNASRRGHGPFHTVNRGDNRVSGHDKGTVVESLHLTRCKYATCRGSVNGNISPCQIELVCSGWRSKIAEKKSTVITSCTAQSLLAEWACSSGILLSLAAFRTSKGPYLAAHWPHTDRCGRHRPEPSAAAPCHHMSYSATLPPLYHRTRH